MKNVFRIAMFAAATFAITPAFAQTHKDSTLGAKIDRTSKKVATKTKTTAKKVGHKTSEIAANGESRIVDKKFEGKVAPGNHNVYIDKNSKYYYVNKKGHRVYITEAQMKDKPAQ
jgi:hypothetical protein